MMRDVNLSGKIRRLGILLLVSFVLLMTGCGGESGAASSVDTSTKKAAEKTEASKKADASEDDPGDQAEEVGSAEARAAEKLRVKRC